MIRLIGILVVLFSNSYLLAQSVTINPNGEIKSSLLQGNGDRNVSVNSGGTLKINNGQIANTKYLSLGFGNFRPKDNYSNFLTDQYSNMYFSNGTFSINSAVNLPHGSTVTEFRMFVLDNDSNTALGCALAKYSHIDGASFTNAVFMLGISTSANNSPNFRYESSNSINQPIIDNENFYYYINCNASSNWSSNLKLRSVRISYTE